MSGRAIKCKLLPPPPKKPWTGFHSKWSAAMYIESVGWDHVAAGLCTAPKCDRAKLYIDADAVRQVGKKVRPHWKGY